MTVSKLSEAFTAPIKPKTCKLGAALNDMDDDDAQAVLGALRSEDWSSTQISRVLRAHDVIVSESVVKEHRRANCCCAIRP